MLKVADKSKGSSENIDETDQVEWKTVRKIT